MKQKPKEQPEQKIDFYNITKRSDLNILKGKTATSKNIIFQFTEKYITELQKDLEKPLATQILLSSAKEFAGYIAAYQDQNWPESIYVKELFIDPKSQGKGLGRELVEQIINTAIINNISSIVTQTEKENIIAQKFYESLGFEKIENNDWKKGVTYKKII